ncbi:MAG: hypothetical protein COA73_01550 [Candidatus Hydrogenedentota bacterium]|nr:MAG: hypothetical protein COA73_01550 [Candidatus Hydrogenedentota bacterium]
MINTITPIFQSLFAVYVAISSLTGCATMGQSNVGNRIVLVQDKGFEPQEKTVLFEEDFSSGTLDEWEYKGDWEIVDGAVHIKAKAGWPTLSRPISTPHYELRFTFTRNTPWNENDFLTINFRYIDQNNRVWVAFGQESMHLQEIIQGDFASFESQAISSYREVPYQVRIVAQGSKITVFRGEVGKQELVVMNTLESSLLTTDSLQFTVRAGADFTLDDIQILK